MAAKKRAKARMGRPPGRTQDAALHLRLDAETLARLDAVTAQVAATGMSRSAVARLCILLGLGAAERDVRALLVAAAGTAPKRRAR